jgi:threonine/homoserine/homoserine lactone efflux protein
MTFIMLILGIVASVICVISGIVVCIAAARQREVLRNKSAELEHKQ